MDGGRLRGTVGVRAERLVAQSQSSRETASTTVCAWVVLPKSSVSRTNIRKLTRETKLMESGLFGPVRLVEKTGP